MELCTSGIAKVLSIVTNKELETVNEVRTLWFHYGHVGSTVIHRIYQKCQQLLTDDDDRSEVVIYLNWLGKLASSYFVGDSPYESPPEKYSQEIDEIIILLAEIEQEQNLPFIPAAPFAPRLVNYHPGNFTFGYHEDDDLFELEMTSAQFIPVPKEQEQYFQPWDGSNNPPRRRREPVARVPLEINQEYLPKRKSPSEIAFQEEMEDVILSSTERINEDKRERVSTIISEFHSDKNHKGAQAFLRSYKLAKILEDFSKHGKKSLPVIEPTQPMLIQELLLILGGDVPNGSFAVGITEVTKDPGKAAVKKDPAIVETAVSTPESSHDRGPPERLIIRSIDPLGIKLNPKTKAPELFQEPNSKPVATRLKPKSQRVRSPHRRTLAEWKSRAVNARADVRAQTFSRTGRTRGSTRISRTPRILESQSSTYYLDDYDYSDVLPTEYDEIG
jgi:hypothetical protein